MLQIYINFGPSNRISSAKPVPKNKAKIGQMKR